MITNRSTIVASQLLQIKAIKLSPQTPFTWASGLRSPIYCDNRLVLSYPAARQVIANQFAELANQFSGITGIAGVATAGIPHGVLLADRLNLPFIYVREKAKAHGRQNQIEGELPAGARVLVVEDLISTGGSSLKAVEALREAGFDVAGVVAVFTYGFHAAQTAFGQADCHLETLTDYETMLKTAISEHYLDASQLETLQKWSKDPAGWSQEWLTKNS